MRSIWRFLLTLMTAIAVPVQGMAAAGMIHCAAVPASEHMHYAHDVVSEGVDHAHAGGADASDSVAPDEGVADKAPVASSFKEKTASGSHTCSACAACCVAGALPACTTLIPPPDVSTSYVRAVPVAVVSFISSGPTRPPRIHLA